MTKADLKYLNELLPDRRVLYDQDGNMVLSYVDDVRDVAARMADYMERKYKIPLEKVRKKRAANGRKIKVLQAKIKKIKGCMNDNKKIANEMFEKQMIIQCSMLVRYPEDSDINGAPDSETDPQMPCISGENGEWVWKPTINASTGQITNWEIGTTASINYKVCDCCGLKIYDNGKKIHDDENYVPDFLSPREEGYGDYVYMNIDANGNIQGWDAVKVSDFLNAEK